MVFEIEAIIWILQIVSGAIAGTALGFAFADDLIPNIKKIAAIGATLSALPILMPLAMSLGKLDPNSAINLANLLLQLTVGEIGGIISSILFSFFGVFLKGVSGGDFR
jgi:hypothetical protein